MKKFVFGVFLGLIFLMTGCLEEDGYSLSKMWVGFGVLQEVDTDSYKIIMDNDDVLIPVASNHNHSWQENVHDDNGKALVNGDRLQVNYTVLSDEVDETGKVESYFVKLNSVKKVLMKEILDVTVENQDSMGNDPVIVKDYWMKDSLLNFKIKYWGHNEVHFINLVKQPGVLTSESQPIQLELRHNDNNDSEDIPYFAYVSFKLTNLKIAGLDSVQFVVNSTDYDGNEFTYEGTYNYGN